MELAKIEGDEIVIRIKIDALPVAMAGSPLGLDWHVTDAAEFAKEFVHELNNEQEDGTTPLHVVFDKAMSSAIDNGCDGIEEGPDKEFE